MTQIVFSAVIVVENIDDLQVSNLLTLWHSILLGLWRVNYHHKIIVINLQFIVIEMTSEEEASSLLLLLLFVVNNS